ncbi:MAG: DNA translocase FtsK, partial [Patescibacteria group bacterium]
MPRSRSIFGRRKFQVKLKQSTVNSIGASLLFAISGLIWLSFIRQGTLLISLNDFLTRNLGFIPTLYFPLIPIFGGLMITKIKTSLSSANVFVGSILTLSALIGLFHDGFVGSQVWQNLTVLIYYPGAFLFLVATLGIGLIISFNIPFEDVVNFILDLFRKIFAFFGRFKGPDLANTPLNRSIKLGGLTGKPAVIPVKQPSLFSSKPVEIKGMGTQSNKAPSSNIKPITPLPAAATDTVWHYPPLTLLSENISGKADRGNINSNAAIIEKTLEAFGITAKVIEINMGPAVTQYALEVAIGTKLSKISALGSDLALALAAPTGQIRIEAPIPGRSLVGIELPNRSPEFVSLRKILESDNAKNHKSKLAVSMGLDVSGEPIVADIAKMPHVLIAGSTGSGKSVCINSFIASLLFRASPQEVNLIMVDPKRVELTGYNGIPHLLSPVIVEPEKVLSALKWATGEMERRYKLFAEVGVRNLEGYNELSGFQALPYIVIVIDELADIMLFAQVEVEDTITRIAQMARATGIHLVLATQRPSVDIITGLIKANIHTLIAFSVSYMIDYKVVLDKPGAEKLLGRGDMLYIPPDAAKPIRIQGSFISDKEIKSLIDFLKKQGVAPHYTEEVTNTPIGRIGGRGGRGSSFISPNGED